LAGLETVAVIVSDGNPNEISIIENTLRDGLTVVEEAEAFHGLQVNFGYKLEEMSRIFGNRGQIDIAGTIGRNALVRNDAYPQVKINLHLFQ
jgi:hypothetical protein